MDLVYKFFIKAQSRYKHRIARINNKIKISSRPRVPIKVYLILKKEILTMPIISIFYGICIQMFWNDHMPPHFHALYAEYEVSIDLKTLRVIKGKMPRRALVLVLDWALEHRKELNENWKLCRQQQPPKQISPLQ